MSRYGGMSEVSAVERQLQRMVKLGYPISEDVREKMVRWLLELADPENGSKESIRMSAIRSLVLCDAVNVKRERNEVDAARPPAVTMVQQIEHYAAVFAGPLAAGKGMGQNGPSLGTSPQAQLPQADAPKAADG